MNKEYKCPFCGTSDFKVENGYYVCQICGNQTIIESKSTPVEEKPEQPQKQSSLEIISAIFVFLCPPVGWVLCVITLLKAKKENNKRKMITAIWTMVCSIICLIILIVNLS